MPDTDDALPEVDEGTADQRRLDALAPADTSRLESAQAAIDEARQAAHPVLKHQDPEPAAAPITPDADVPDPEPSDEPDSPAKPEQPEDAPDGQPTPAESPG